MGQADPSILITLGVAAALYPVLAVVLNGHPSGRQIAAFTTALLVILIAITGPIDQLTRDRSFSVYIFQQLLLIFAAPPLLLLGLPDWMIRPLFLNRGKDLIDSFFALLGSLQLVSDGGGRSVGLTEQRCEAAAELAPSRPLAHCGAIGGAAIPLRRSTSAASRI